MSISDQIVVMKSGLVQQIGRPQDVYDDPVNHFVAKFLGTPPVNVFEGRIENGQLWIGQAAVLPAPAAQPQKVYVGIRPEGFIPDPEGPLECRVHAVEVMGRDTSVVCSHDAASAQIRAIIDAENKISGKTVRFRLRPAKVDAFHIETEERIALS